MMDSSEAREGRRDAVTCRMLATPKPAVKNALTERASAADFDLERDDITLHHSLNF
jgi:hypothetical protein